jgi:TM2 domain-containing membrane protein YozV
MSLQTPITVLVFFFLFSFYPTSGASAKTIQLDGPQMISYQMGDTLFVASDVCVSDSLTKGDRKEMNKKKLISAFFAFPFPLGFMGAHRVMLGTKPWVPVVYVATFGGCFGVLPLIDFFVIIFSKDIEQYENNPNIFMWLK